MGDKGVLVISKTLAGVFALTIVALFVGEGKNKLVCYKNFLQFDIIKLL